MIRPAAALLLAIVWAAAPGAQVFRSGTEAVRVDVLVTDGRRPVGGLTTSDFELRDSGVAQTIADVQISEIPFSVTLVLDTSTSVAGEPLRELQDAAGAAIDALRPDDRASLFAFSDEIRRLAAWNSSKPDLKSAISALRADGSTSLFDVAMAAIVQRDPEPGRRNLIVLFTDGDDTSSWLPQDAPLDLALRTDVVVESVIVRPAPARSATIPLQALARRSGVRLTPDQPVLSSVNFVEELASRTGGHLVTPGFGSLRATFEHIVSEFRSRYVLTYTPAGVAQAGWHPLEVRLKGRRAKITARRGYERGATSI